AGPHGAYAEPRPVRLRRPAGDDGRRRRASRHRADAARDDGAPEARRNDRALPDSLDFGVRSLADSRFAKIFPPARNSYTFWRTKDRGAAAATRIRSRSPSLASSRRLRLVFSRRSSRPFISLDARPRRCLDARRTLAREIRWCGRRVNDANWRRSGTASARKQAILSPASGSRQDRET